jgi:hypothetical protein
MKRAAGATQDDREVNLRTAGNQNILNVGMNNISDQGENERG